MVVDTSGVIVIPPNLSVTLSSKARSIVYNGLPLSNFSGTLIIDSAKMKVRATKFNLIGTEMAMDMTYQNLKTETALFDFAIQAKDFDVRKAYNEIKLFHDLAPAAGKAQGIISLDYKLKGRLDKSMGPVYPSLDGGGVLSVRNVQFAGFKLLNSVSRESGKSEISDPNVKDVALKTTIRNNVITLEKVRIRLAGFRLRVQGQSSFDKQLSFKMRLGLPPLGIIGIPMTVTGTSENPRVKLGRQDADSLEEKEDTY